MSFIYAIIAVLVTMVLHWLSQFIFKSVGALPRFLIAFGFGGVLLCVSQIILEVSVEETLPAAI